MSDEYRNAVDSFEYLVTLAKPGGGFTEKDIELLYYHVAFLKLYPAYGELSKPKTTGESP